jgi:predicted nucleotidyltransferase component of viral defense system
MKAVDLAGAALTPAQRKLIEALAKSPIRDSFYLSGGTALAGFYVKHRVSKDLDFFTRSDVPVETLRSFLARARRAAGR